MGGYVYIPGAMNICEHCKKPLHTPTKEMWWYEETWHATPVPGKRVIMHGACAVQALISGLVRKLNVR